MSTNYIESIDKCQETASDQRPVGKMEGDRRWRGGATTTGKKQRGGGQG